MGRFKRGVSSSSLFLGIPPRADYVTHLARRGTFGSFKITTNFCLFFLLPYSNPSFKYLFEILRGWSIYRKHSLLGVGSIFPTSGGLAPPLSSSVLEDTWIGFRRGHYWISELTHKMRTELLREERRHLTNWISRTGLCVRRSTFEQLHLRYQLDHKRRLFHLFPISPPIYHLN